jgi:hypothetical protein
MLSDLGPGSVEPSCINPQPPSKPSTSSHDRSNVLALTSNRSRAAPTGNGPATSIAAPYQTLSVAMRRSNMHKPAELPTASAKRPSAADR